MKIDQLYKKGYTAYVISFNSHYKLHKLFPPKFSKVIGHHITLDYDVFPNPNIEYGTVEELEVVGYAEDIGIEAFVVKVNGKITRPDGKVFHLTWSLDPLLGKTPKDSNTLIATKGYTKIKSFTILSKFQHIAF